MIKVGEKRTSVRVLINHNLNVDWLIDPVGIRSLEYKCAYRDDGEDKKALERCLSLPWAGGVITSVVWVKIL